MINWNRKFPYIISCLNLLLIFPILRTPAPVPKYWKKLLNCNSNESYFFSLQDKSEVDIERIKATLMLCYGYVALFSPVSLIVSRMEATILRSITPHFVNVKVSLCGTYCYSAWLYKNSKRICNGFSWWGVIPPWLFLSWLNHSD